jgi:hypothetical protein
MQFLVDEAGIQSSMANPAFLTWKKRDRALLTLFYSTFSPPVLAMVVGLGTSQEVWNTLEERFTSTTKVNMLNLKLELQRTRKGNETFSSNLQRIKATRDKLFAGVHTDNEELLHVILKGLPKEYACFSSAIRTRDDSLSFEKISVHLQTEKQSMNEVSKSNYALAMFVSNNNKQYDNGQLFNRHRGKNSFHYGRRGISSNYNPNSSQPQFQQNAN